MKALDFSVFTATQLKSYYDMGYAWGQLDARNDNAYDCSRVGKIESEAFYKMAIDGYHFGYSDSIK